MDFDFIIVASTYVDEIYTTCIQLNIEMQKVIFLNPHNKSEGYFDLDDIKTLLGEENYTNFLAEFNLFQQSFIERDIETYSRLNVRNNFKINTNNLWPIITDKYALAGTIKNYFWQDLWAAKLIVNSRINKQFDIGSRIDGFIAHLLAAGIDVTMIDIREFPEKIGGLYTIVDDATYLRQIPDNSIESMSALCSLEHFGLGRYGDPIDPEACFKCFDNIQKKIIKGGHLYISVPVGKERVEFNAHRVFYASTIIECFSSMELLEYSCTAEGKMEYNVDIHKYDQDTHNGDYRYGLFHFKKI